MSGCSSKTDAADKNTDESQSLSGQKLFVYCGAGMTKSFSKITDLFKTETGCEVQVVFANAAQSQSQIKTTGEGDLFIAGSEDDLKPIEDYVTESKDLVKHIPVLAVKNGNPMKILDLNDLTKEGVEVVFGDGKAMPLGKIANKALTDLGILSNVNVIARVATAPEIFNALSFDECDAVIVWKENVTGSTSEIVEMTDLDVYVKKIPAAKLKSSENTEALDVFMAFLDADTAKNIWKNYGYEVVN